jgi:cation diffusion facilitator CzcD-associated flavoprotein CzcO
MLTNISKHTVCFSDFPWPQDTPTFPSAAHVGEYLSAYAQRYLPPGVLLLGCRVTSVRRSEADEKWWVTWQTGNRQETASFDYFILACGFFSEPYIPPISGLDRLTDTMSHSSTYTSPEPFKDKHVAIVGGSFSAVEVATDIAPHVASLHHVTPRFTWVLPRYLPVKSAGSRPAFLPLDLAFFRSSNLRRDQSKSRRELWKELNAYFLSVCGDQSLTSEHLKVTMDGPPYIAISDFYTHFVRSGHITLHTGYVTAITPSDSNALRISFNSSNTLEHITHVIFGTGFHPIAISKILPSSLLTAIDFSPKDRFVPFLLHRSTLHPSLRNAAFVGCYPGVYWTILELQARWSAALFSGRLPWPDDGAMRAGIAVERQIRESKPREQYPKGDYVAFAGELAQELGLGLPTPASVNPHRLTVHDIFGPHYFAAPAALTQDFDAQIGQHSACQRSAETQCLLNGLEHTLSSSADSAAFVASAIFRALHGSWRLRRTYTSRNSLFPSGSSSGTARFVFRKPVGEVNMDACSESKYRDLVHVKEHLYSESTEVLTSTNREFHGSQQYVYRYDERLDKLEVYFAKRDDMASIDRLFHPLEIQPPHPSSVSTCAIPSGDDSKQHGQGELVSWTALCSHRCAEDTYEGRYTFFFEGVELAKWGIVYLVKGPKKDYTMETSYVRDIHVPEGNAGVYK